MKASKPLDQLDLNILSLLYQDARITNREIAQQVGLAPSSCLERVKRLQQEGVILGTSLQLNFNALGGHIQAMISVRLSNHSQASVASFQQDILNQPEVISVFHMGGENDFLVHVSVSHTEHLRDFVFTALTERQEVNHVETALVYDYKISANLPSFQ